VRALLRFNALAVTHPSTAVGLFELVAQTPRALMKSVPVKVCKVWQTRGREANPPIVVVVAADPEVVWVTALVKVPVVENTLTIQVRALLRFNALAVTHPSTAVGLFELVAQTPKALMKSVPVKVCRV
jgi:hypothetical protein